METITRKSMLYKTGVEYGDYTLNHVLGCSHGCKYPCYAFMMKKRFGVVKTYEDWVQPKIVSNALELLEKEIPKLKDKIKSVFLCFSTDPFPYQYPEIGAMSFEIIKMLNDAGIKCTVLTKGLLPIQLAKLSEKNEYGISLVSLDENFRKEYEPNTAPYEERIRALRLLKDEGCKTWVSMEPYPTPNIVEQSLSWIITELWWIDKLVFGRWNYNKLVSQYKAHNEFYSECIDTVKDICTHYGIEYLIKKGTVIENVD